MSNFSAQLHKISNKQGFIAALDQSGGSTPKALKLYGIDEDAYHNDEEMFAIVHQMRTRIITSPVFTGDRILAAILFENTLDRDIEGQNSAAYLWNVKNVVPFLKIDKGLAHETDGVHLMNAITNLSELLDKAKSRHVFGTKMRSLILRANSEGITNVVAQQFDLAHTIQAAGLVPIIEPEIDINSSQKAEAEVLLKEALIRQLDLLDAEQQVMLKLSLPEQANFYSDCIKHSRVLKVVALSGGYSREEANRRLAENHEMVASFSRALTNGLLAGQSNEEFNSLLDTAIETILQASSR